MSIIYLSLQFNFKLLYFCFLSSFIIFLWTKFCDLLFYFLFFNFLSSFSLEKDRTHYKILFCCTDTIRTVILGYLFILCGQIRETSLLHIPFVSIYPSIVSFFFMCFYHAKDGKASYNIHATMDTSSANIKRVRFFFAYSLYNTHTINYISHNYYIISFQQWRSVFYLFSL